MRLDRLTLDLLKRAMDLTGSLIARICPEQAELPTPRTKFDLRALVNHTVYDLQTFNMLNGGQREVPGRDLIDDHWSCAYRHAAHQLMATWQTRDLNDTLRLWIGEFPVRWAIGQHASDIAVHGWDIARATGQTADFDPEVAEVGLEWARENLKPHFRGQAFGPEVSVSPDAPPYDRLADFFLQVGGLRTGHAVLSKLTINGEA